MSSSHQHIVVTPGNGLFYCLSCGSSLRAAQANNALISDNSGALPQALAKSFEQLEEGQGAINDEYCWMHHGPGFGGWTCGHHDCQGS